MGDRDELLLLWAHGGGRDANAGCSFNPARADFQMAQADRV
jgi:hypothetical protein